jgi:hypothetical protein
LLGQFERHIQPEGQSDPAPSPSAGHSHVQAEEGHPSGSIGLAKDTTSRQRLRAIKGTNVVQAKEATLEDIVSTLVFTIDPPSINNNNKSSTLTFDCHSSRKLAVREIEK